MTTLTKKMSEDLTDYLLEAGVKARYLHSEIDTLERIQIIRELRLGEYDVLVGVNLLREGLDLPEVSLVAVLDADKEGFLRGKTALVQTIGRAARPVVWMSAVLPRRKPSLSASSTATRDTSGRSRPSRRRFTPTRTSYSPRRSSRMIAIRSSVSISEWRYRARTPASSR